MTTKRHVTCALGVIQTHTRLEPLPLSVDKADHGDGRVELLGRKTNESVKPLLGRGVKQHQRAQGAQALGLVGGYGCGDHGQTSG